MSAFVLVIVAALVIKQFDILITLCTLQKWLNSLYVLVGFQSVYGLQSVLLLLFCFTYIMSLLLRLFSSYFHRFCFKTWFYVYRKIFRIQFHMNWFSFVRFTALCQQLRHIERLDLYRNMKKKLNTKWMCMENILHKIPTKAEYIYGIANKVILGIM